MIRVKEHGRYCPGCFNKYTIQQTMECMIEQTAKTEPAIIADKVKRGIPLTEYQKLYHVCTGCDTYKLDTKTCPEDQCQQHYCTRCHDKWRHAICEGCHAIDPHTYQPCIDPHCDHPWCQSTYFEQQNLDLVVSHPCTCKKTKSHTICDNCFKSHTTPINAKTREHINHICEVTKQRQLIRASEPERRRKLTQALKLLDLPLRDDSTLCKAYIRSARLTGTHNNVYKIANRMAQMKYLYEYTDYKHNMWYLRIGLCESGPLYSYDGEDVIDNTPRLAEEMVLKDIGGFPRTWPWIVPNRLRQFRGLVRVKIRLIQIREVYYKPGNKYSQYLKQIYKRK